MSDQPSIIRQETQHTVSTPEGSQVSTSKPSDPQGPQVRKVLAGQENQDGDGAEAIDLPSPIASVASGQSQAPVFERSVPAAQAEVPAADAQERAPPAAAAPVLERSIQDANELTTALPPELDPLANQFETSVDRFLRERRLTLPEQADEAPPASDAPVFERSIQEHREPVLVDGLIPAGSEEGPVFERSTHDHRVAAPPDDAARSGPLDGPVFERSLQDRTVDLPGSMAAPQEMLAVPPPIARAVAPALEPVPLAQAQQIISETARDIQTKVEQALGQADGQWAEMDFPARLVKLKIENDKVRDKLDELEDLADQAKR